MSDLARAHIDNLQLPQVLDAVEGAVAAGQEVVQVLLQAQRVQPGRERRAAVAAQRLHLQGDREECGEDMESVQ